jgi:hypothetical protein
VSAKRCRVGFLRVLLARVTEEDGLDLCPSGVKRKKERTGCLADS